MQIIKLHHPVDHTKLTTEPVVLAMGFFDGVHTGHREVLTTARAKAAELGVKFGVLTYNQHPSIVFKQHTRPIRYLTTLNRKLALFEELGVEIAYVADFTSALAQLTPLDFVNQYMVGLNAQAVVAGFDHTYGPKNVATMAQLPGFAAGRFEVIEVPEVRIDGFEGVSTHARELVDHGEIEALNHLLTIPYQTSGVVVHGEARGREMGFPTLNIETTAGERLPAEGVYITTVNVNGVWYQGMGQIGHNITFGDHRPQTLEINLLDFKAEVYGEFVAVRWHKYLRGEVKFTGMPGLIEQLEQDERDTRTYFAQQQ